MQLKENKKKSKNSIIEKFYNTDSNQPTFFGIIHFICWLFAMYLSFKCNNNQFDIMGFLGAFCCPEIYIIKKLFIDKCNFQNPSYQQYQYQPPYQQYQPPYQQYQYQPPQPQYQPPQPQYQYQYQPPYQPRY